MQLSEITRQVNSIGSAWEEFKSVNDRRLAEIERKSSADPLTTEQLNRINDSLDKYKTRLSKMENVLSRPSASMDYGFAGNPVQSEHKEAFCNYIRKGIETNLSTLETKALSVSSDPDGGYLVTPTISSNIVKTIFETSPMRQIASVETISSDSLELIEDINDISSGWISETAVPTDTNTPQIGKKNIPVHELYAQPKATQKLIDDSNIDIESWLAAKLADNFSRKENTAFISGNGVGQPRGILTYASGTNWGQIQQIGTGSSGVITSDSLVNLYYSLKDGYTVKANFLMSRAAIQAIRLLKSTTNQYLWQPSLSAGTPDTLMGVPAMHAADMPTPAAASLSVAFGDFSKAYQIVDRIGIRVLRDPFTEKPFVNFYTIKRVGGDVVNFEAIKLLLLS